MININKSKLLFSTLALLLFTTAAHADLLPGYQSYNGVTNDVGPDLASVIEYDVTKAACDQYQADLDQYLIDNDAVLSQLSDAEDNLAVMSEYEQYVSDNFVDAYDKDTVLQCGKYLYFYGHFDTTGAPKVMINWLLQYFDDFFGPGMSYFGMYEDPNPVATIPAPASNPGIGTRQLPLGLVHSSGDFGASVPVYSFACSSCHLKKMDDGNYAVGVGNTEFDYAKMTAAQGQLPLSTLLNIPGDAFDPQGLKATIAGAVAASNLKYGQDAAKNAFLSEVNPVITAGSAPEDLSSIQSTQQEQDRNWRTWTGVMDFMVRPMQDDGVHTLTRIMNTNAITTDEKVLNQHGFKQHAGLSWNGGGYNLIQFIRGFITITPSDQINPESRAEYNYWVNEYRYLPLVRYLETIAEPNLPTDRSFDVVAAKRGEAIFDNNCSSCHNGPGGETSRAYDHAEVNVEASHANIMNPFWDPTAFGGIGGWENGIASIAARFPAGLTGEITRQVKAPRFISLWDNNRLLHNGSVGGLAELLTCQAGRTSYASVIPTVDGVPTLEEHFVANPMFSNQGHEFGCHFSAGDKADLITFIETFSTNRNVGNKYNGQFDTVCQVGSNGKSQVVNLTFTKGKRMDLLVKKYSDANCQVFDTTLVKNPSFGLSWEMEVGSAFINSRGFESHNVTYTKPDGTIAEDTIALENGQLANAEEGDPEERGMFATVKTDYPGLNGLWRNNFCAAGNTRTLSMVQDGVRVDKLVTYNLPNCTGGVFSMVNTAAWSFSDPKWVQAGIRSDSIPKYNLKLIMKNLNDGSTKTEWINVFENSLSTMFNNYWAASLNANGQHFTRVYNINTAE